ncbi:MAG: signal recognition particle-docking protein FtsY [Candidatus Binatia bacterium]|nr:signal recognition particle-docking protein FtsY [Candidatus Binatia bacterium]
MPEWTNPAMVGWASAWGIALLVVLFGLLRDRLRARADVEAAAEPPGSAPEREVERSAGDRFRLGLSKSSDALARRIRGALGQDADLDALLEGLEQGLIESDVGVRTTQTLLEAVRGLPAADRTEAGVRAALRREVGSLLAQEPGGGEPTGEAPWVCLVVGVNGVGKTTTIGKLATRHREAGRSVLLIAGDTFRAAAIEQLEVWAGRSGAEIVRQETGADPSSVVFDGVAAAVARKTDVVLIDTAGRLHTKVNLMEELKKVRRIVERQCPGAPHEVLLVLDATTGQNAISQARSFTEAVGVSGVALSKLDGSARGGMAVAIRHELGLPVRYVGLGETAADLQPFDAGAFVDGLLPDVE